MSDHHQLGAFLSSYPDLELEVSTGPYGVADDIIDELRKLGWRKPRTITTAEELDALPTESVIRDTFGCVFEVARGSSFGTAYLMPGDDEPQVVVLPVTVLHEGVRDE